MEIVAKLIIFERLFREIFIVDAICAIGPTNDSYTSILNDILQAINSLGIGKISTTPILFESRFVYFLQNLW